MKQIQFKGLQKDMEILVKGSIYKGNTYKVFELHKGFCVITDNKGDLLALPEVMVHKGEVSIYVETKEKSLDNYEDQIDYWHEQYLGEEQLHKFLGLTLEEYKGLVEPAPSPDNSLEQALRSMGIPPSFATRTKEDENFEVKDLLRLVGRTSITDMPQEHTYIKTTTEKCNCDGCTEGDDEELIPLYLTQDQADKLATFLSFVQEDEDLYEVAMELEEYVDEETYEELSAKVELVIESGLPMLDAQILMDENCMTMRFGG